MGDEEVNKGIIKVNKGILGENQQNHTGIWEIPWEWGQNSQSLAGGENESWRNPEGLSFHLSIPEVQIPADSHEIMDNMGGKHPKNWQDFV